jgi:hypothetical protein
MTGTWRNRVSYRPDRPQTRASLAVAMPCRPFRGPRLAMRPNGGMVAGTLVIARNPDPDSKLPYLLRLPLEGGLVLKARDTWPRTARVYCHLAGDWPEQPEVLEEVPTALCRRRGAAIDLVLDRAQLSRSQFVFTEARKRPAIFWQTQGTARAANPGSRIPRRRSVARSRSWSTPASDTRSGSRAGRSRRNGLRCLPATTL